MVKEHQRNITGFIRKLYYAYFGVKLGGQDKLVIPSTRVSCVNGTAEQEVNTGSKNIEHQVHLLNLGARTFCAKVMSIRKKYYCHPLILN
jgi:hypothetical protein